MHKICVKSFMTIREVEIELNNALLLIGEQASGKNTLGKLIYFFKSLYLWILIKHLKCTLRLRSTKPYFPMRSNH